MGKLKINKLIILLEARKKRIGFFAAVTSSILLAFILALIIWSNGILAMLNPAAVYCTELGYNYIIESNPEGDRGLCQLPNGEAVDAWQFLQGQVAIEYSYCAKEGYELKVVYTEDT